jgi:glucose-6-phosphate dehydrogenase assembly protein OpcA
MMDDHVGPGPGVALKKVSIGALRQELHALWNAEAMANKMALRARTHNLVIYTEDGAPIDVIAQRIVETVGGRPGRAIVIRALPDARDSLDAWVTTYRRPWGRRLMCGELIVFSVSGSLRDEVHGQVISLFAPDVPAYLWWEKVPDPEDHLFTHLTPESDEVLVDSDMFEPSGASLRQLGSLGLPRLGDLNWARLTPWCRALAELWDVPELSSTLKAIRSLDVHYVAEGDFRNSARVLLLVGWLIDRLGWEVTDVQAGPTGGYTIRWGKGAEWHGKVELVESVDEHMPPGEIRQVLIQAGEEPPYVMPQLELAPGSRNIVITHDNAAVQPARLSLDYRAVSLARALATEIDLGYDPLYSRALSRAAEIVGAVS